MPQTITLEPRLTVEAAGALWAELRGQGGAVLDAAQVRHLGAAGLQVLLMARMQGGVTLRDPSPAMEAALAEMGAGDLLQGGDA